VCECELRGRRKASFWRSVAAVYDRRSFECSEAGNSFGWEDGTYPNFPLGHGNQDRYGFH